MDLYVVEYWLNIPTFLQYYYNAVIVYNIIQVLHAVTVHKYIVISWFIILYS